MSAQSRQGYKLTEAGEIPEDWEIEPVDSLASITTGNKNTQDRIDDGNYPFFVRSQTIEKINSYSFNGEAVLTAGDGVGTGKIYHYIKGKFDFHQRVYKISDFSERLDGFYFYKYFSNNFYSRIMQMTAKSSVDSVRREMIADMPIPLPPVAEQKAIATALADMDALINGLDQLISKKIDIKQAAMQQLLTGKQRLTGFNGKWDIAVLGNLLTMKATYGIVTAGEFQSSGIPMMRGGDIKGGQIGHDLPYVTHEKSNEYSRTLIKQDDVVISLVGYPGEAAKVPARLQGANISRAVGLLRLNKLIEPDYLVSYLNSPMGRRMVLAPSAGSAQLVVNLTALNKLEFPLPSRPEQIAIATILSDMDSELASLDTRRNKARQLKQGMMQELLTGKIRLSC
jgi:type I restriction enzyme S subunit